MRRRDFIKVVAGSAFAWPLAAHAQQAEPMRRVGVLMGFPESDSQAQGYIAALQDGLQKLGLPRDHDDKLAERDFRGYKIEGGQYFYHANLVGANFENGELQRAHMDSADLSNANLRHCNLSAAIFTGTKLTKADLRGADLSHASGLTEAQLREAILDAGTKLPNAFHDLVR